MTFKKYVYMLLILPFLQFCKAPCKTESDLNRNYISEDLRSLFLFNKGTYWVYQNQDATKKDSMYISYYKKEWTSIDKTTCNTSETAFMTIKSTGRYFLNQDSVVMKASIRTLFKLEKYNHLLFDSLEYFSFNEKAFGARSNGMSDVYINFKMSQNLVLNNKSFDGAYYEYKDSGRETNLFLQKNAGIIGWVNKLDTFNLVKYQIVKAN